MFSFGFNVTLALAAALTFSAAAYAGNIWDGGAGTINDNWTTGANWNDNQPPANNGMADIVMAGTTSIFPNVNVPYNIHGLLFWFDAGSFQLAGQTLTIGAGGITQGDAGLQRIINPITISAHQTWETLSGPLHVGNPTGFGTTVTLGGATPRTLTIGGDFQTTLFGRIHGFGSLVQFGGGGLVLDGDESNTYVGATVVNHGQLFLNKPVNVIAVPTNLVIGDGTGVSSDVVRLGTHELIPAHEQIADTSHVTINSSGLLNLSGNAETIGGLTVTGGNSGSVTTGSGTLTVTGRLALNGGTFNAVVQTITAGSIEIGGSTSPLFIGAGAPRRVTCLGNLRLGVGTTGGGKYQSASGSLTVGGDLLIGGLGGGTGAFVCGSIPPEVTGAIRIGAGGTFQRPFTSGTLRAGSVSVLSGGVFSDNSPTGGNCEVGTFLQDGGTVNGTLRLTATTFQYSGGAFNGRLELTAGVLSLNQDFTAPNGLSLALGPYTFPAGRSLTLGGGGLSMNDASLTIRGSVTATQLFVAADSRVAQPSPFPASLTVSGDTYVGMPGIVGPGTYEIDSPDASASFNRIFLGSTPSTGNLLISAGTFVASGTTEIGRGHVTQTGGVATFANVISGTNGSINFSGGVTSAGDIDGAGSLSVTGNGSLTVNRIRQGALTITGANPRVVIRPNGTDAATGRVSALDLGTPALTAITGRLDLANNDLIVDYTAASPLATVRQYIASGHDAGAWDGPGLRTSLGTASTLGLGYAEAADLFTTFPATFSGQQVDSTAVLVAFTRYGDATLDGVVNLDDFNRLAANFGATGAAWSQGDFDYDGLVNLADFNRLAANFGLSAAGPAITAPDWAALASAVPEPGAAMPLVALCALRRRRRNLC